MDWLIYGMVYLGSALMVYNIYSYVQYARHLQEKKDWGKERTYLYIPIVLLVLFLLGYLAVGIFGKPDLIISGILFGGSIFVFIIFQLIQFITNRVQENEHLEAQLIAAEESSKTKNAILSSISHEMRTPMNAIIGLDFIARQRPDLHPETRLQLEKIDESARHLMALIENILDMSDIDSGHIVMKHETFSLQELLENINVILRGQCAAKDLYYSYAVIGSLDDYYVGDKGKLRQVLLSLLDNAVKFTSSGTITFLTEQTGSSANSRTLRFIVKDTGKGIDKEFLPKLFEPFSREDTTTTGRYDGIGLSLAVTRRIVELMDGTIQAESAVGVGSTFTVTVKLGASDRKAEQKPPAEVQSAMDAVSSAELKEPEISVPEDTGEKTEDENHAASVTNPEDKAKDADSANDDHDSSFPATAEGGAVSESLAGKRVLIVEDIDLNAEIVADLLEMEEISSERADNGETAVKMFSSSPLNYYDAILMDLRMPVMNGLDSARNIRALNRPDAAAVPIIALTANASYDDRQNVIAAGMDGHLSKPVDPDLLFETLRKLIRDKTTEIRF